MPKDSQTIVSMMNDLGIREYEQQVLNHLLEFNYSRYLIAGCSELKLLIFILFIRIHITHSGRS